MIRRRRIDRPARPLPRKGHANFVAAMLATLVVAGGCRRDAPEAGPRAAGATTAPVASAVAPTVASLTPAGTDLLLGMGAGDHLVAVSTYDGHKPGASALPRVGDYERADWERISDLKPALLLVQINPQRVPENLSRSAADLGIPLVNIHIDTLEDIAPALKQLGEALHEPAKAAAAAEVMRQKLEAVKARVAGLPPVSTLVATDSSGTGIVGPGAFLDQILAIAGGKNAAADAGQPYPTLDREGMVSRAPEVVIHLLPDATPQVLAQAKQFWASMPDLPAVKAGRVYYLTDSSSLQPGLKVGDLAGQIADRLHPKLAATSRQSPI